MNAPAKAPWLEHRERGTRSATRFMKWLALRCGRGVARLALYPVCAYFLLFSPRARKASRQYLELALGRKPRPGDLWRHYFTFAATVLDRVYFLGGQFDRFEVEIQGLDLVLRTLEGGRGCLLIGAHLGSFELLRNLAIEHGMRVSAVMYESNADKITDVLHSVNAAIASSTIAPSAVDTVLRISERLAAGEIVAMLGDRFAGSERRVMCRFFGREAAFPQGPLLLAQSLRVPVMLFVGLYRGGARYSVLFEPFCDEPSEERATRAAWVQQSAQRYAGRLEQLCRLAPYNWFNFYDFWGKRAD
ncbi:MAG: acyl-CoA synthetase [Burkholderiales bacterium]